MSELAKALAEFQKTLPSISKDEHASAGTRGSYNYAGLDAVAGKVLPALAKVGLSYSATTEFDEDHRFRLRYALLHESGERREGVFPIPVLDDAQKMGSWLTYARRYALLCVTGVHPGGEDDDGAATTPTASSFHGGNAASGRPASSRPADQTPAAVKETAAPETGHVDEKAQVLASLAHELDQRHVTVPELKTQVYDVAKNDSLLNGLVVNPFTGTMCKLSVVITHARKEAEQRAADAARDQQDGEYQ